MQITLQDLQKSFGPTVVCDHINLRIGDGELVALLGPSGSGKTSLLRMIAGLEQPDAGAILFDDTDITRTDVRDRNIGFVFQHYALFGHMTVAENIAFGLSVLPASRRPSRAEIDARVAHLLDKVQLPGLGKRYPAQLSGGQRQRVALARALATRPKVLLLDEPFGALDAKVRKDLRRWLRQIHHDMGVTTVFVTHDQEEALEVADRVVVMSAGHVEQVGTPNEVYEHPATPFVIEFLGDVNRLHPQGSATPTYVRPHQIQVLPIPAGAPVPMDAIPAQWKQTQIVGPYTYMEFIRDDDHSLIDVQLTRSEHQALEHQLPLSSGTRVWLRPTRVTEFVDAGAGI
ncbi:MAG: sulfate/molybdate ABC transporter ATP-binding protein [Brachymonas sp.]|uniref:sulfate/molybdate ABC transporter ATP-binding protein n=1 Tax=unclassified Brachymonas TaxID=2621329 RepID=UPI0035B4F0F0